MDANRFDNVVRALGGGMDRRQLAKALIGGVAGMLAISRRPAAHAQAVDCVPPCSAGLVCTASGTCADSCAVEGSCSAQADCCIGYTCAGTTEGAATCLETCQADVGADCSPTGLNCCESEVFLLTCEAGTCCRTEGGECSDSEDCCGELGCNDSNLCAPELCIPEGESCNPSDNQCCSDMECTDLGSGPVCFDCIPEGEACETTGCCAGLVCNETMTACVPVCSDDSNCLTGQVCCNSMCVSGVCCEDDDCQLSCARGQCNADHQCGFVTLCPPEVVGTYECCPVGPGLDYCYGTAEKADFECCDNDDCVLAAAGEFCLVGVCLNGFCYADPDDSICDTGECCCEDGSCSEGCCEPSTCDDDHDCPKGSICCAGYCREIECCIDDILTGGDPNDRCPDKCTCFEGLCVDKDQNHCRHCVNDKECPDGECCCRNGVCSDHCCKEPGCKHDNDCAKGTCCCKNGSCSTHCCDKPDDDTPEIEELPNTGAGPQEGQTPWMTGAALAAGAAGAARGENRQG